MTDAANADAPALPTVLREQRLEALREAFLYEYQPVGPTETAIVFDLVGHAMALESCVVSSDAIQRQAARGLLTFGAVTGQTVDDDALLAGAASTDALHRCERRGLGHSRAFYRALAKLEEIQALRSKGTQRGIDVPPTPFHSEEECRSYLLQRFRHGDQACRRCGSTKGSFIASRQCWECATCKAQTGLREGTVMAKSTIPLWQWFEAVRWLSWRPTLANVELASKLGIGRLTTVRNMAKKIRSAMAMENRSNLLAGLDLLYGMPNDLPESSASVQKKKRQTESYGPHPKKKAGNPCSQTI